MNRLNSKRDNNIKRKNRVRTSLRVNSTHPRLSVGISNRHVSVQIIDDTAHKTLASASTVNQTLKGTMSEKAAEIGKQIAKKAKEKKVKQVTLDRGPKLYHGRVKILADAAREEGLIV